MTLQERRIKYLRALRSGEYFQSRGSMGTGNTRCALGVAVQEFGSRQEYLEAYWMNLLGLTREEASRIAVWNDNLRLTFDQIATKLEEKWEIDAGLSKPSVPAEAPAPLKVPKPAPKPEPVPA